MKHLKEEFDRLTFKEAVMYGLTIACFVAATVAIFLSMFIEPRGEIHASVLTYFGISMTFCGSVLGISTHYSSELTKFKAEITGLMANQSMTETA
ncbi:MAG: hypothetical protein K2M31_09405 [Muribaculaceae bacterium]|nr:hypothetical protein [Muribaculaceae bacterium]